MDECRQRIRAFDGSGRNVTGDVLWDRYAGTQKDLRTGKEVPSDFDLRKVVPLPDGSDGKPEADRMYDAWGVLSDSWDVEGGDSGFEFSAEPFYSDEGSCPEIMKALSLQNPGITFVCDWYFVPSYGDGTPECDGRSVWRDGRLVDRTTPLWDGSEEETGPADYPYDGDYLAWAAAEKPFRLKEKRNR